MFLLCGACISTNITPDPFRSGHSLLFFFFFYLQLTPGPKTITTTVPFLVWGFFKLITPFIDPVTRDKLKFNEDMTKYVPKEQLWAEWGGDLQFDYEHAEYWPALVELCAQRRADRVRRWELGGKQIGELEDYLSGRVEVGVLAKPPVEASDDVAVSEKVSVKETETGEGVNTTTA